MALIASAVNATSSIFKDMWKEYFYADSIPNDRLIVKAQKKVGKTTQNKGNDEVITDGSSIIVSPGQCAIITDNGRIVDICDTEGEFIYHAKEKPSVLVSDFIKSSFAESIRRFTFGSDIATSQRVYYINMKEIMGNMFGTQNPVMFRVVDERAGIDMDIRLKMCGSYTFMIIDPVIFYEFITGNVVDSYKKVDIEKQLRHEMISCLNPALAQIGAKGIRYTELFLHANDLEETCRNLLKDLWEQNRGIQLCNITFDSITPYDEDIAIIQRLQRGATFTDQRIAQANMMDAQMDALRNASSNTAGAMTGFMGMNMVNGAMQGFGAMTQQAPMNRPQMPTSSNPTVDGTMRGKWTCACGRDWDNAFGFCPICGASRK